MYRLIDDTIGGVDTNSYSCFCFKWTCCIRCLYFAGQDTSDSIGENDECAFCCCNDLIVYCQCGFIDGHTCNLFILCIGFLIKDEITHNPDI